MNLFRSYRIAFIPFVLLIVSITGSSQTAKPTPPPRDDDVIKVDSRLVVVPVSVVDASGQPVLGLKAQDFRILEENKLQQIEQVGDAEKVPLEIALLFDISASTDPMFKFEQETAAKFLEQVMRPEDRATVFTVGIEPVLLQNRDSAERAATSIRGIVPTKEQTAFFDAVRRAAEHLQKNTPPGRRKVLLIISDGEDTNSAGITKAIWDAERKVADNVQGEKLRELRVKARNGAKTAEQNRVLRVLQNADTVFYSINPAGSSYQLNKISMFGQENMQKFAFETGGSAFLPQFSPTDLKDNLQNSSNTKKNTAILENIFRKLANELRAQYLVQYYSETEYPVNRYVTLDVGLSNTGVGQIRARKGYFAKN